MRKVRSLLLCATMFGASTVAFPAMAQDATAPAEDAAAEEEATGNDIIVTASKREQTLQDTPIAVSVTSAETIAQAQVRDLIDIQSLVPSLRVSQLQSSANTNFVIRGFGNGANNAGIEPSVGVFIDGVYRSRSAAQIGDLPNLRRVEVLRGPQSTLFGKNASAGIISVVTAEPQFDFDAGGEISYGNYGAFIAKLDATGPLSDTVAFSIAGNYNRRDGYVRDLALGQDVNDRSRYGFRGQLLFDAHDSVKIRLIADYDNIDEICCAVANIVNGPTGAIVNALAGGTGLVAASPFSYTVRNNLPSSNQIDNYGASAQVDYEFGALSLTSITAYREVRADTNQDSDFTSADLIGRNAQQLAINTFTQEIRLASDYDGPFNFLLGGYYFDESIDQHNQLLYGTQFRPYANALVGAASGGALSLATLESVFGASEGAPTRYTNTFFATGQGFNENYTLTDSAYSFFGTVDFEITDQLTISGGFNYTHDSKDFRTNNISTDRFSGINLDSPLYAGFRNTLLFQGALAQQVGAALALGRSATATEIGTFAGANPAAFAAISAGSTAFANANQNNPAANPLGGLRALQFLPPFLNLPNSVEPGQTRDSDWSYSLRASYEMSDAISLYATYATGFKASSINLSRDSRPTAADRARIVTAGFATTNLSTGTRFAGPENSTVIEVGLKAQFDAIAFNVAVFDQQVKGFQNNTFIGTGFSLVNAGSETVRGVEFDTSINPIDPFTFTAAVTYLDATYDSFVNSGIFVNVVEQNLTGRTPVGVPEWSVSLGGAYVHEFDSGTTLSARLDYHYESKVQIIETQPTITREINNFNGALILNLENGVELSIWGRNLTNNHYLTTIFPSVAQSGSISGYPSLPRTYGVAARFRF